MAVPMTVMPVIVMAIMSPVPIVPLIAAILRAVTSICHPVANAITAIAKSILQSILSITNVWAFRPITDAGTVPDTRSIS
jgi:hypothetical protein